MPDREKYIDIFKQIVKAKKKYYRNDNEIPIRISYQCVVDILALLKEQETVEHACDILRANGWKETEPLCSECDAVHVVLCKDCRWGDSARNGKGEEMILCYNGDTGIEDGYLHEPDWYCREGERKEGR